MRSVTSISEAVCPPTKTLPASAVPAVACGMVVRRSVRTSCWVDTAFGACLGVTITMAAFRPGLGIGGVASATSGALPIAPTSFSTAASSAPSVAAVGVGNDIATRSGALAPSPKPSVMRS